MLFICDVNLKYFRILATMLVDLFLQLFMFCTTATKNNCFHIIGDNL